MPVNGPGHYQEAEVLLARAKNTGLEGDLETANLLAAAQVHATLALAAATALNDNSADAGGMPLEDYHAWTLAAGVWQPKPKGQTA
ncbi:hypothetical protein ACWDA7_19515 [Streptomyces sp. NPDC001156]